MMFELGQANREAQQAAWNAKEAKEREERAARCRLRFQGPWSSVRILFEIVHAFVFRRRGACMSQSKRRRCELFELHDPMATKISRRHILPPPRRELEKWPGIHKEVEAMLVVKVVTREAQKAKQSREER